MLKGTFDLIASFASGTPGGKLWGVNRNTGADLLFQIDPTSGAHIAGVFSIQGTAVDFVEIQPQHNLYDIDDIAIDPIDGHMYGIMNQGGGPSHLVIIDTATGQTTDVGRFTRQDTGEEIQDMEGLAFFNDGQLYSSTGKDWRSGRNILWKIDKQTGVGQLQGEFRGLFMGDATDLSPGQQVRRISDIEALGCLSAPAFVVVEKQLNGNDADTPPGVVLLQDTSFTWSYLVRNTSGLPLTNISVTDDNGTPDDSTDDFVACVIDRLLPGETNQSTQGRISCTQADRAMFGIHNTIATVTATYIDPGTGLERTLTHSDPAYYMGYTPPAVGDFVWIDTNENGLQDPFEPPAANVEVYLYEVPLGQSDGQLVGRQTTDAHGFYLFDSLVPGEYYLEFDLSSTPYNSFTVHSQGTDRKLDSDALAGGQNQGRTPRFLLSSNTTDQSWDAGILGGNAMTELGDQVWHDRNGNGLQEEGEPGISGVQVRLLDTNGSVIQSKTTDFLGHYRFIDLTPDDYILEATTPEGFRPTQANIGQDENVDSDFQTPGSQTCSPSSEQPCKPITQIVNLSPGEVQMALDAGYWQPAAIGGQVWDDENADGLQIVGEEPLSAISISLFDSVGNLLRTTETNEQGRYAFEDLPPGIYRVELDLDDETSFQLCPTTSENHFSPDNDRTEALLLLSGTSMYDVDAALYVSQADLQLTLIPASVSCDPVTLQSCDPVTALPVGTSLRYIYQIDNPGNQSLTDVKLTDDGCSPLIFATGDINNNSVLDPAERWVYSCDQPIMETTNIVAQVVARQLNDPTAPTLESEAAIIINSVQASLILSTTPSADVVQPGDEITLDYELENTGDVALETPQFTVLPQATCETELAELQGGDTNNNGKLDSSEIWRYRCQIIVEEDTRLVTTVTAQDSIGRTIEREAVTQVDVINSAIELSIEATELCTPATPQPCDPGNLQFVYTIQNPGDDPITDLAISDTICADPMLDSGDINLNGQLDPGEEWRYSCQTTISDPQITARATIDGKDSQGQVVQDNTTFMFELSQPTASLGDRVWEDLNRNGLQDPGEPGLAGITVRLLDSQEHLRTTTTDATGRYTFSDLPPGDYRLFVVQPDDYDFTLPNQGIVEDLSAEEQDSDVGSDGSANPFTLNAGQDETKIDAGLVLKSATLGDFVWEDNNGNGVQDANESGVVGVQVLLWGLRRGESAVQKIDETATDLAGRYSFENLDPTLTYAVEFVPPLGQQFTQPNQASDATPTANDGLMDSDVNPENGRTEPLVLTAGQHKTSIDAGLLHAQLDISDRIWLDRNQDGLEAPNEPGIGGITILLWLDDNQDGTPDILVDSRITENDGTYSFEALEPDLVYFLQVVPEAELDFTQVHTTNDPSTSELSTSDFDPDTGLSPPFKPRLCNSATFQLCSFAAGLIPAYATIGDRIWEDTNGDGIQGQPSQEPSLPSILIRLWRDNDKDGTPDDQIASTTSDSNGHYRFTELDPTFTYFVEFILPPDRGPTLAGQGETHLDSDATAEACSAAHSQECRAATGPVVLAPGQLKLDIDLGLLPIRFRISGTVWHDINQNGNRESDEPALSDSIVRLWLDSDDNGEPDTPGPLLAVAPDGTYESANLDPDLVYFIRIQPTDGYGLPFASNGTPTLDRNTGFSQPLRYVPNEATAILNTGLELLPETLRGLVWDDRNKDGIGNIQVALMTGDEVDNDVILSVITNPVGEYRFDGILPGIYRIIFVSPNGITFSPRNQGNGPEIFSAPNADTGITSPFTIDQTHSQDIEALNAGLIPAGNRGFRLESRIESQDADTIGQAVQANPQDKLRFSYTLINTGDAPLSWVTLNDDIFGELTETCGLPASVPTDDQLTCTITRDADDVPNGHRNSGTATVLGVGRQSDSAWYQTDPRYATVGNFVWQDDNQDGLQDDNEQGISNIQVELLDTLGVTVAKTVSDEDGFYQFVGLEPSSAAQNQVYRVHFVRPNTLTYFAQQTTTCDLQPATCNLRDSDANPSSGRTAPFEPSAGERINHIDAGLYNLAQGRPASIGNRVWEDIDGNGLQDEGESGVANVQVRLLDNNGLLRSTTLTDDEGRYKFTELAPASYLVEFVAPNGHQITNPDQGIDRDQDSDPAPATRKTSTIRLGLGEDNQSIDAGLYRPVTLSGFVWIDENGDGKQDQGESGLADITVDLYAVEGRSPLESAQTDRSGIYTFEGLAPGEYYVIVHKPEAYEFTIPQACASVACDLQDSDANPLSGVTQAVSIQSGGRDDSLDAGLLTSLSISGRLWDDRNLDGLQSANEPGIALPSATVQLLDSATGALLATAPLGDSPRDVGRYQFNVNPGQYQVLFSLPEGYSLSQRTLSQSTELPTDPTRDSDPDPTTGMTAILVVEAGRPLSQIDGGIQQQLSIGDLVWSDLNNNGLQDTGEPGIGGVALRLYDDTGQIVATTESSDSGYYEFLDLEAGRYQVEVQVPQNFQLTEPNRGAADIDSNIDPDISRSEIITLDPSTLQLCNSAVLQLCTIDIGLIANDAAITLEKLTNGQDADQAPGPEIAIGQPVVWEYIITNVGQQPLTKIQIRDDQLGFVTDGCPQGGEPSLILEPGESITCRKEGVAEAGQYRNTAVAQAFVPGRSGDYVQDEDLSHYFGGGVDMSVTLVENEDPANAGSQLYYTLVYTNSGPAIARNFQIIDELPEGVLFNQLISTEPEMELPAITWLPESGMKVVWTVDELLPGQGGEIIFEVDTDPSLNGDTILNSVIITGAPCNSQPCNAPTLLDLDPSNNHDYEETTFRIQGMGFPTAIELLEFSARPNEKGLEVRWVTAAEVNSQDFRLMRSVTEDVGSAVAVTPLLIKSIGEQGGEYQFMDQSAIAGLTYHYWLLETETTGKKNYYGPINQHRMTR